MVSIEPVSGFIIAEKYTEDRKGETWTKLIEDAIEKLPVEVIQVTSDEGTGLLNHTLKGLDVHHSPDCFHVPYEVGKGTSGALAAKIKKTRKAYEQSTHKVEKLIKKIHDCMGGRKSKKGLRELEIQVGEAVEYELDCLIDFEIAQKNQKTALLAKAEIGAVYHPYNTKTGKKQTTEKVTDLLENCFERLNTAAKDLSDTCKNRVAKAERVLDKMTATITFFFGMVSIYLENSTFTEREKSQIEEVLIPGYYLQAVANKEKNKDKKKDISNKSENILSEFHQKHGEFSGYSEDKIQQMQKAAVECAQIFQRSSSCVEGRNAQLSLRHHGLHRLSASSLKAQTVVHNYYRTNKEGKTPAERFFEAKHEDLFQYLLEKMDYPARPRKRKRDAA